MRRSTALQTVDRTEKDKPRKSRSQKDTLDPGSARAILLSAAKSLFARRGLSGTSIRDIAREAKHNSSLISYYFGGKDGLYRECLRQIGEMRLEMIQKILQPPNSQEEFASRLRQFTGNLFELYLNDHEAGMIIVREFDRRNSPAEQVFKETFLRIFELVMQFFTNAQAAGWLDAKKDPFILASLLFGAVTNEMRFDHIRKRMFGRSIRDPIERQRVEDHLLHIFQK
jgi:AcrR family transcriptional regulator